MTRPREGARHTQDVVAFELLRGVRSVGSVVWERGGWVRLRIRDENERRFLLEHFGVPASKENVDDVRFRREELSAGELERLCVALRERRGYAVVPRPAQPD